MIPYRNACRHERHLPKLCLIAERAPKENLDGPQPAIIILIVHHFLLFFRQVVRLKSARVEGLYVQYKYIYR